MSLINSSSKPELQEVLLIEFAKESTTMLLRNQLLTLRESASEALRCRRLPSYRHRNCTVCKQRAARLECSLFITPVTVCLAVLYHTFQWFYNHIYSMLYSHHKGSYCMYLAAVIIQVYDTVLYHTITI